MFTGIYGHNTGAYSSDCWADHCNGTEDLNDAGYRCVNMGEMRVPTTYESVINMYALDKEDIAIMRRYHHAKITIVDEQLGRVIDALEERYFLGNSLLILCSDHGEWLGDYWMSHKWLMYDPIVRDGCGSRAGEEIDNLVSLIDLEPNDLERDPHELWNLCDSSEHRQLPVDLLTDSLCWLASATHYNIGESRQRSRYYDMRWLIPDNAFLPRCQRTSRASLV